jgi:hypothetical protein
MYLYSCLHVLVFYNLNSEVFESLAKFIHIMAEFGCKDLPVVFAGGFAVCQSFFQIAVLLFQFSYLFEISFPGFFFLRSDTQFKICLLTNRQEWYGSLLLFCPT